MPNGPGQHAQHDSLLVAALAAGDLADNDGDRATALVRDCGECRALHDDLIAIARATAALPAAVRPRDYQLSEEQAARLQGGSWRRIAAAFASPRLAFTRQLGVGLTTLGVAGLLLSAVSSLPLAAGGAASAPYAAPEELRATDGRAEGAPAGGEPAASAEPSGVAAPAASEPAATSRSGLPVFGANGSAAPSPLGADEGSEASPDTVAQGAVETPDRDTSGAGEPDDQRLEAREEVVAPGSVPLLLLGSMMALVAGIVLLVTRRIVAG